MGSPILPERAPTGALASAFTESDHALFFARDEVGRASGRTAGRISGRGCHRCRRRAGRRDRGDRQDRRQAIDQKKVASYAVGVVKDGRTRAGPRLWLCRFGKRRAGHGRDGLSPGLDHQAVHGHGDHAAGRRGQALGRRRADQVPARLSDGRPQDHRQSSAQSHLGHQELHRAPRISSSGSGTTSATTSCWRCSRTNRSISSPASNGATATRATTCWA